jgi:hypothetical protein
VRSFVLAIALLFMALLASLTADDIVRNGVTPLAVVAILILILFAIGIVGALRQPPSE